MCRGCPAAVPVSSAALPTILRLTRQKSPAVCDACGGELYQRADDTEAAIKNRIAVYKKQTQPLIDYYKKKGLLIDVDGEREIDEVRSDIMKALERFH